MSCGNNVKKIITACYQSVIYFDWFCLCLFIGGSMNATDQCLNRYIEARLGPVPGWSMGYGYDLHVWTDADELQSWYDFLKEQLGGWPHLIGARADIYDAGNNRMMQSDSLGLPNAFLSEIFWEGDYIGHYDYRVPYKWYAEVFDHKNKPQFQEDRFRIREHDVFENKDYTLEMTVRGLWHSTMTGGVANIWENLFPAQAFQESNPYDNQVEGKIQDVPFTVDIYGIIYDFFVTMYNYVIAERP